MPAVTAPHFLCLTQALQLNDLMFVVIVGPYARLRGLRLPTVPAARFGLAAQNPDNSLLLRSCQSFLTRRSFSTSFQSPVVICVCRC